MLDEIVVNLKDASQEAELGDGSLNMTLMRKFNKDLLSKYKQWVSNNHRNENEGTLREFVDRESEVSTAASETMSGSLKEPLRSRRMFYWHDHPSCDKRATNMDFGLVRALRE